MKRQPGLDLLRAIAIVWVMVFHAYIIDGGTWGGTLRWSGWMGVDLFFALSGFLIGAQLLQPLARGEPLHAGRFYLRRAFRILPAYAVVLALYLAWPAFRETPPMRPAWQFLTFTMNLWPAPTGQRAFSHAWSLCVEEHFYLLCPLLAWALARRASLRAVVAVASVLVLGGMLLRGGLWIHEVAPVLQAGGDAGAVYQRTLYVPTWARLDDLLAGVLLAAVRVYRPLWWCRLQSRANTLALLGLVIVAACMLGFRQHRMDLWPNVVGYPLLALGLAALVCAAASPHGVLGRHRLPGVQWLALASYSLYLTHKAVYGLVHRRLGAWVDGHGTWTVLAYACAVLLAGAGLYYGVERPFLRWRARLLANTRGRVHGAPAAAG
jgi:peptidoglycan/LPS O-acetylase OafA/YrhL